MTTNDDDLLAMLDAERPPAWIPEEPGATLLGEVQRYEEGFTAFGTQNICIIRDDDGAIHALWLFGSVLKDEFRKKRPKPGERIGVRYVETRQPQKAGAQPYKVFRLEVAGRGSEVPQFFAGDDDPLPWDNDNGNVPYDRTETPRERAAEPVEHPAGPLVPLEPKDEPQDEPKLKPPGGAVANLKISELQIKALTTLCEKIGVAAEDWSDLSRAEAAKLITALQED